MIRDLNLNDLVKLEKDAKFPLPNLNSDLFFIKKSIELDNELIGSFFVKNTTETSLIFKDVSRLNRARALKQIFHYLAFELVKLGYNDTHVFVPNMSDYENILKKHFGFEDIVGTPLVLRGK